MFGVQPLLRLIMVAASVVVAVPPEDPLLRTDAGRGFFRELLRLGQYGLVPTERAAFIVDRGAGAVACELWPPSRLPVQETFRGAMPPGTVAIIHTHPIDWPRPSEQDREQAARLGIPVYVLTRNAIYRTSGPQDTALVREGLWFRDAPDARCEQMPFPAPPGVTIR